MNADSVESAGDGDDKMGKRLNLEVFWSIEQNWGIWGLRGNLRGVVKDTPRASIVA